MFIVTLFIIAKVWEQTRYSSVSKSMNKLWYIQTMEIINQHCKRWAIKHEKIQRNLKCMVMSERKLIWKDYLLYDPKYILEKKTGDSKMIIKRSVAIRGWR